MWWRCVLQRWQTAPLLPGSPSLCLLPELVLECIHVSANYLLSISQYAKELWMAVVCNPVTLLQVAHPGETVLEKLWLSRTYANIYITQLITSEVYNWSEAIECVGRHGFTGGGQAVGKK